MEILESLLPYRVRLLFCSVSFIECERLAHTECVMKIGSSEEFIQKCKPTDLVACLKGYLSNEACSVKDKDTLPTIKSLISSVEKKFQKDPKFCQKKKKHEIFVNYLQDYFTGKIFLFSFL